MRRRVYSFNSPSVLYYPWSAMAMFRKVVPIVVLFCTTLGWSILGVSSYCPICRNSPWENYFGGQMDCVAPLDWNYGLYLHEIRLPTIDPSKFLLFGRTVGATFYKYCPSGTCFRFANQKCVNPIDWRNDCRFVDYNNPELDCPTEIKPPGTTTVATTTTDIMPAGTVLCDPEATVIDGYSCKTPNVEQAGTLCVMNDAFKELNCESNCVISDIVGGLNAFVCLEYVPPPIRATI